MRLQASHGKRGASAMLQAKTLRENKAPGGAEEDGKDLEPTMDLSPAESCKQLPGLSVP